MASVIIADDHPLMLAGLDSVLRAAGHNVAAKAENGTAVLALAEEADVLIVDLAMPCGSGLDVLHGLRARGDSRPVILMLTAANAASVQAVQGADGVVLKASQPGRLLECIDAVMAGGRWIDPDVSDPPTAEAVLPAGGKLARLSDRDQAIVRLVVTGLRNRDIGERLGMTEGNVKVTLHRIYDRLGVANRVELAMKARDELDMVPVLT